MDEITIDGRVKFVTWIRVMDYVTPHRLDSLFMWQKYYVILFGEAGGYAGT